MNLKVWIDHYLWQGVDAIYLIDNGSTDDPLPILQPYIDSQKVFYFHMPEKHQQLKHYLDVIRNESLIEKTEWLIICDLDEFYYSHPNRLIDTIGDFNEYDVVYSNWRMFGSDGLIEHPKDIRKSILYRDEELAPSTKYIFKPNKVSLDKMDIHHIEGDLHSTYENEKIRLNHYPIQSKEFYTKVKMTRGDIANQSWENIRDMKYFEDYDKSKTRKDEDLPNLLAAATNV